MVKVCFKIQICPIIWHGGSSSVHWHSKHYITIEFVHISVQVVSAIYCTTKREMT
jgi:hypothetical protein